MSTGPDLTPVLVALVDRLRDEGLAVGADRVLAFHEAVASLGAGDVLDVVWAGRLTLCSDPLDLSRYDRVVAEVFAGRLKDRRSTVFEFLSRQPEWTPVGTDDGGQDVPPDEDPIPVTLQASRTERLRTRDIALLTDEERAQLAALLAALRLPGEQRRTRRHQRARRGEVDAHATVRAMLAAGGEPAALHRRRQRRRPRNVVLLVDVSGSMTPHADALLRFAHATTRGRPGSVEVFTLGTRLTRVTRELALRDADLALRAVGAAVPDWGGGTRLGETLRTFLDEWGQRGTARGAVVVVLSDGWERDDPTLLGTQVARLSRLAHRVVWANPRAGRDGFAPTASGMAAALPWCDDLVPVTSLDGLLALAQVVAGSARPAVARTTPPTHTGTPMAAGGPRA